MRTTLSQTDAGRYVVLALVCLLSMITYLDRVCFGAAAQNIQAELGLSSVANLKGAFTAFAVAYAIFEIPTGWLGDRWGPKRTLLRIVLWWSACTALTGLVGWQLGSFVLGGLGTLIALRFLFGAGEAGAYPNITRALHNWFPASHWARVQGYVWMSGRLMGGLTPLIWAVLVSGTAWTLPLVNWRTAFLLFGGVGLVWCVVFVAKFRDHPAEPSPDLETGRKVRERQQAIALSDLGQWGFLRSPSLWLLCMLYFCVNYGWYFHITYLPSYMKLRYAVADESLMGAMYKGGPLWVGAVGCLVGGYLADGLSRRLGDRRRARRLLGFVSLTLCAGCWLEASTAPNAHTFFVFVSASAFCIDLTLGSTWATCQDVGRASPAVAAACMNTVGTFGAAAAGWMTGTIVEWSVARRAADAAHGALPSSPTRLAELAGYQNAFLTYAGVALVAALCWLSFRDTADDR